MENDGCRGCVGVPKGSTRCFVTFNGKNPGKKCLLSRGEKEEVGKILSSQTTSIHPTFEVKPIFSGKEFLRRNACGFPHAETQDMKGIVETLDLG